MDTPSKIAYTVTADSTGGRAGTSSVPALGITHIMRAPKELGGPGDGANPEALFAMGYGACFQGAMGLAAKELGIDTKDSVVRTTIGLGPEGDSFALTSRYSSPASSSTAPKPSSTAPTSCAPTPRPRAATCPSPSPRLPPSEGTR